jgi:nicotinamidase/pyrazinamidase
VTRFSGFRRGLRKRCGGPIRAANAGSGSTPCCTVTHDFNGGNSLKSCFLIVDPQKDFVDGSLAVEEGKEVLERISDHLVRNHYDYIIASSDWHVAPANHFSSEPDFVDTWPEHCVAYTEGADFHPALLVEPQEVFYKGRFTAAYSAFEGASAKGAMLEKWLDDHEIKYLYISGIELVNCVEATLKDAVALGKYVVIFYPTLTAALEPDKATENWQRIQRETGCLISADY